ncbi:MULTISPECIES: arylamine N-acetyltransferase family protein [Pseudoalteromonas]|jgi:N-hydroxyarylamine O-acetyltransferase|uniref:arylamine N-acetyltransferase family protein n=1 Tax=Pseudoalteromonas TaxID=53246 RepID=UPI000826B759|nr:MULTISPECIES: arylamine N-acetyltransferase [Pseudoalteromonas]QMW14728.1 arylamine N-acetyltransferase [Pseudoalteromonas sp. MT33b]|tara:strand:- start:3380 stop:4189 length:810 start_codon:yes stop_codon:yes gene_type:complete
MQNYIKHYLNSLAIDYINEDRNLALIERLQAAHLARYSFSSVNALQAKSLSLDDDKVFSRLINLQEGGYCFEHNKIFFLALVALGFDVEILIARVMLNGREENPRSHRLTKLTLEGKHYLLDVGFGVSTPVIALPIDQSSRVSEGVNLYEISRRDRLIDVRQVLPNTQHLYRVELAQFYESDCEIAHFYSHHHPDAAFVNNLVVSRIEKGERWLIRNNLLHYWHETSAVHTQQVIQSREQLHTLLTDTFLLNVSKATSAWLMERYVLAA